jgi:hypothetical protein
MAVSQEVSLGACGYATLHCMSSRDKLRLASAAGDFCVTQSHSRQLWAKTHLAPPSLEQPPRAAPAQQVQALPGARSSSKGSSYQDTVDRSMHDSFIVHRWAVGTAVCQLVHTVFESCNGRRCGIAQSVQGTTPHSAHVRRVSKAE